MARITGDSSKASENARDLMGAEETTMTTTIIQIEVRERVGLIRINRPEAMNALNGAVMEEVAQALEGYDENPQVGAMVITGDDRAFAAGADIKEMADASAVEMLLSDRIGKWDRIRRIRKPVIAAVSGWCLGGGNELAMACDMIVASETARFGQPEINLGVIPARRHAAIDAGRGSRRDGGRPQQPDPDSTRSAGVRFGQSGSPGEAYLDEAIRLANEIAARAPLAVRLGKEAVNHAFESFLADGVADERRAFYFLFSTHDQKEGMQAFTAKRKPEWTGT
jgi:enoyl-CoA hydratase